MEPGFDDVHVDWHMTQAEWRELKKILLRNAWRSQYIRQLLKEKKI